MLNRPRVTPKRPLGPRSNLRASVSKPSNKTAKVFGRPASFEAARLAAPLSLTGDKHPSTSTFQHAPVASSSSSTNNSEVQTPVSPTHTVASLLNDMETCPPSRSDSHHSWEREKPSIHIDTRIKGSSGFSRDSLESNPPQPDEVGQSIYSSLRARLSRESSMAAVSRGAQSVLSVASGGSSGSRGSNKSSDASQQSGSSLRVVGRGGSGSRIRQFGPNAQKPDPTLIVKQEHRPTLIRPSGRGGLGSRPKPLAPLVPPKDSSTQKSSSTQTDTLIRPSGRGGLASRPKPPGAVSSPSLLKILGKRKARLDKGKGKAKEEPRAIHPIPPQQTYSISNGSTSSLSTIHFIGETGEPTTPFFPDDRSLHSSNEDNGKSNTTPSSLFSSDQSSSRTTFSDHPNENDEYSDSRPVTPVDHRQRNISKLARTLGDDLPSSVIFKNSTSRRPSDPSPVRKDRNSTAFRRASVSMSSLGSMFIRSGARTRDSVSASTITDDLHQFGLADDLSESWRNMNDSSTSIPQPPASPIVFSPPSPTAVPNPKSTPELSSNGHSDDESEAEQSIELDALSYASSTLSRSNSYSAASSERPSIASHSRSTSTSILSERRLANRSIWLIPVNDDDDDLHVGHIHRLDVAEKPQNWSGEWNNDLHQVIKSLRLL
ncbi:hypothetical protein JR316_0001504 [Psilocybe cubensis]|uniref:Uncharacterized protein n=1 Tax=Psilocybe cubensis TaxID=181762 RepID=A0ACB8HJ97_PSICU|nr:hypothetical protein JR316_0001504 [Psilocybe cubensis]KAH9487429.1 hypothetical protein JR316_0001504 [Psilocybe cubensis]